eukprot:1224763-Rhodomonas_salina.1
MIIGSHGLRLLVTAGGSESTQPEAQAWHDHDDHQPQADPGRRTPTRPGALSEHPTERNLEPGGLTPRGRVQPVYCSERRGGKTPPHY